MTNKVVLFDAVAKQWLTFREPVAVVETWRVDEVAAGLRRVEAMVQAHDLWAAGFLNYEAAPAFDPAFQVRTGGDMPMLWFGLYAGVQRSGSPIGFWPPDAYTLGEWTPSVGAKAYEAAIHTIKAHIERGETYQVNYTLRLRAPFSGEAETLFWTLVQAQQCAYAAYVDIGQFAICSASPELFFSLDDGQLTMRPMKGTAARGLTLAADEAQAEWLHNSEKNRAENVMIVDMIRNDLGRVAETGSVRVPRLFEVERYPTVWQMTSTVTAASRAPFREIMAALFPCASITGAPKVRTMEIITGLETAPRRTYTGSIGFLTPQMRAQFNVAIRTVLIDRAAEEAEYGVGGGIVWDSTVGEEYTECQIKARVLTERRPAFSLLETILWTPGEGYYLLGEHLKRLRDSATFFAIPIDFPAIQRSLRRVSEAFQRRPHRVRLLVAPDGAPTCQTFPLPLSRPPASGLVHLGLADEPIDSTNVFLYHKTTHRTVYETARQRHPNCDDVLLWNERGEITETTIANIVVQIDGELFTPPVRCGLLPGTQRAILLAQGKIRERVMPLATLAECERIYLINSVRKWREATLVKETPWEPVGTHGNL